MCCICNVIVAAPASPAKAATPRNRYLGGRMDPDTASGASLDVGGRLPALTRADGTPVWRPQYTRDSVLLAVLHGAECGPCTRFRQDLTRAQPDFRAWDGKLVIAAPGDHEGAAGVAEPAVARVPDAVGGPPAVIIADRFGHIYHVEAGGQAHAFSEPRELEEWLRFIGTQCPE
jgi:hypothetical protein